MENNAQVISLNNSAYPDGQQSSSTSIIHKVPLPLHQAKKYINELDFSPIINKLITRHKWLKIEAEETCKQYRRYLYLLKKYAKNSDQPSFPPSDDIDEFWHHHILDTKKYQQDCQAIFGRYLHHYPYFGADSKTTITDLQSAFEKTKNLYLKEFNEELPSTRYRFRRLLRWIGL